MSYNSRIPSISLPARRPSNLPQRPGAKRIEQHKIREVRAKLRKYRMAVKLQDVAVPTSLESSSPFQASHSSQGSVSSASRTFPPALSEASYATSHTDFTVVFSQQDGNYLSEPAKKALCPAMKAQKALVRYLESCCDCRRRKVKCSLSHHAIEDILDGDHDEQNEADVQWALEYDSEAKGFDPLSGVHQIEEGTIREEQKSSILQNIDDAANKLGIHTTPDSIYPSTINEGDFEDSLLEPEEVAQCNPPRSSNSFQSFDLPSMSRRQFSTLRTDRTYLLATEIQVLSPNGPCHYYTCLCNPGNCQDTFSSPRELLDHTYRNHPGFQPMAFDPMRLVCVDCMTFCPEMSNSGTCPNPHCSSQQEPVVNICGEFYLPGEIPWMDGDNALVGSMAYGAYSSSFL
ncbi:hypothetical protein V496_05272 [Pseudogymnoascus sp. VKM F-4515 (FW-2607)]|nr:hypothetical protein V496_05272 [Pseudogymnoascus sp. VKM F-4515 (FW-2607)]